MSNLLLKSKTSLAIISGILFAGIITNSIAEKTPISTVQANQAENVNIANLSSPVIHIQEDYQIKEEEKEPEYIPDAKKVERIRSYLAGRNAPLAPFAEEFVRAADYYGIDYRLVASISIIESGGGKNCFRPYNAWGWGKKGFSSWKEGIWTVSGGLAKYYARGLTTPKLISTYYCPPSAESWAGKVQYVMNQIAK